MKTITILAIVLFVFYSCQTSTTKQVKQDSTSENRTDSTLIRSTGADEYGMRQYILVLLKEDKARRPDSAEMARIESGHLKYLKHLMDDRKILVLGPILEDNPIAGICIYDCKTVDEAKKLAASDPAVQSGELVVEAHPWYGTAALMKIPEIHQKIAVKSFGEIAK